MILLHAHVEEPAPGERDDFEGHSVHVILPHRTSEEDRELMRRFTDRAKDKEE